MGVSIKPKGQTMNMTMIEVAIEDLAIETMITREARIECDFDAIFRAIYIDLITNEDFDVILVDMIHNFARRIFEVIGDYEGFVIFDEIELAEKIMTKIGDICF